MDLIPYLLCVLFFLIMEGFFSGSEMAIINCDKLKIRSQASDGIRGASMVEKMLEKPEWLLGTTLVGTNLAEVGNAILVTFLMIKSFPQKGEFYAVLLISPIILFWGEILPKTIFRQKADFLAPRVIYLLWVAARVFAPILWVITVIPRMLPWTSSNVLGINGILEREDLRSLLQMPQNGSDILVEERKMVDRLIELSDKKVQEVMIPLIDVVAVPETASWSEVVRLVVEKGHSRLPVFRERIVQVVGVLHHFDLLLAPDRAGGITSIIRPAFYVPETKQVYELFLYMKKSGNSIAIALDEYGGTTGIITLEDILEEIVGEIDDEYDAKRFKYKKISPSCYLFDARIEIDHLNEKLPFRLPEADYETLGGFLMSKMGQIPNEGDTLRYKNLVFTVEKATARSVQEIRLDILKTRSLGRV